MIGKLTKAPGRHSMSESTSSTDNSSSQARAIKESGKKMCLAEC